MSYSYDQHSIKERIRDATDIVELVGRYLPLQRQGRIYVGRCPWHNDTRPSLQIDQHRQTFKCWVCDIGGDVFAFIMKIENVDFREALEILADKAGITLPKYQRSNATTEDGEGEITRKQLFQAADWVAKIYHTELLQSEEAEAVRIYLEQRKFSAESIKKFTIGYSPLDRKWLLNKTKKSANLIKALESIGNFRQDKKYDFFRGRLIFPIRDEQGRTVAFGGRLVPGTPLNEDDWHKDRKYLNSPDSPLFPKRKILYGLDTAKQHIKRVRRALIMEGYTDCVTAHEFGFGEAVAVLGTALSPDHIRLLKRMDADKIILMLDGDKAGRDKAERDEVLIDFITQGVDMAVLTLPDGLDPCDFLEQHGTDALNALLQTETVDALEHVIKAKTRNIDVKNDIIGSSRALDSILGIIAHAPIKGTSPDDPIRLRLEKTVQSLSVRFLTPEEQVRRRLKEKQQKATRAEGISLRVTGGLTPPRSLTNEAPEQPDDYESWERGEEPAAVSPDMWSRENLPDLLERNMLELWLMDPTAVYAFWEHVFPEQLRSPVTLSIYNQCSELIDQQEKPATFENLMTAFDDPQMKNYLIELECSGREKFFPNKDDDTSELWQEPEFKELKERLTGEIIMAFAQREASRQRQAELNELRGELSEAEKTRRLLELQQKLQG